MISLIYGVSLVLLRTVKLYLSVPLELYTVFSDLVELYTASSVPQTWPKTLVKNLAENPGTPTMY